MWREYRNSLEGLDSEEPISTHGPHHLVGSLKGFLRWRTHHIFLEPLSEIETDGAGFMSTGPNPRLLLRSSRSVTPSGQLLFSFCVPSGSVSLSPVLHASHAEHCQGEVRYQFPSIPPCCKVEHLVFLPRSVGALHLQPLQERARFQITDFNIYELGRLPLLIVVLLTWLRRQILSPTQALELTAGTFTRFFRQGPRELLQQLVDAQIDHQSTITYRLPQQLVSSTSKLEQERYSTDDSVTSRDAIPKRPEEFSAFCRTQLRRFLVPNASSKTLTFAKPKLPQISIIVSLGDKAAFLRPCLWAIAQTVGALHDVVFINNASMETTTQLRQHVKNPKVLENEKGVGLSNMLNRAVEAASGEYILLLDHNNCLLPGTLASAVRTLEKDDTIGVVGGKLIGLDGKLQEAGGIVWRDGSCTGYGCGDEPTRPMYMYQRDVDYCSRAFFLTRKSSWKYIGGFDEDFSSGHYADVDYCHRIQEGGMRVVYDPGALVMSFGVDDPPDLRNAKNWLEDGRRIFHGKHENTLRSHYTSSPEKMLVARCSERTKPRVLVIDDRVPHRRLGRGFPRMNLVVHTLVEVGCAVTFYPRYCPEEEWQFVYADLPAEVEVMMGYGHRRLDKFLEERQGFYTAILVSRLHNMIDFQGIIGRNSCVPYDTRIIYDAESIQALRDIGRRRLSGKKITERTAKALIKREVGSIKIADQVMVTSGVEKNLFLENGIDNVELMTHAPDAEPTPNSFAERKNFLFVGSLVTGSSPNVDSVRWFLHYVFPTVQLQLKKKYGQEAEFWIIGQNACFALGDREFPGVRCFGTVEDLTPYFNQARVFVAPTRYGAGIPLKILESAGHGVPVVATDLLASQLSWAHEKELLVCRVSDHEVFIRHCIRLYTDGDIWRKLREGALSRVREDYSADRFARPLRRLFFDSKSAEARGSFSLLQEPKSVEPTSIKSALERGWHRAKDQSQPVEEDGSAAHAASTLAGVFGALALVEQRIRKEVKLPAFITSRPWLRSIVRPLGEGVFRIGALATLPQYWFDRDVFHTMREIADAQEVLEKRLVQQQRMIEKLQAALEQAQERDPHVMI